MTGPKTDDVSNGEKLEQKQLQAIIDAAVIGNPDLKDRMTIGSAWALMKLPDAALGWTDGSNPMSVPQRMLLVIAHLHLDALPGFKHILWLGNGAYPTAAYWNYHVNRSVKKITAPEFQPLTPEEKEMYGLTSGDMCCQVTQIIEIGGIQQTWTGTGVIGADELAKRDSRNKPMPGLQSTKDKIKTLKTRAQLDMYSRNHPVQGLTNSAEDIAEGLDHGQALTVNVTPEPMLVAASVSATAEDMVAQEQLAAARARFYAFCDQTIGQGGTPDKIVEGWQEILKAADAAIINDAADVLEDWLAAGRPDPDPEPPAKAKAPPSPAPEKKAKPEPKPPKAEEPAKAKTGAGRPSNAQKRFKTAEEGALKFPGCDIARIIGADPAELYAGRESKALDAASQLLENWIVSASMEPFPGQFAVPLPENIIDADDELIPDIFADGASADDLPDPFDLEPSMPPAKNIFVGSDNQKDIITAEGQKAGLAGGGLYALLGAMRNRPMDDVGKVIQLLKQGGGVISKSALEGKAEPANADPATAMATSVPKSAEARKRLETAVRDVTAAGGAPLAILGVNPHNIIEGGSTAELVRSAEILEAFLEKTRGDWPTAGTGVKAYEMLKKWYDSVQIPENMRPKLLELARRKLKDGDHLQLHEIVRLANKGDFRKYNELVEARPARN